MGADSDDEPRSPLALWLVVALVGALGFAVGAWWFER
jgi:hypothetical protein